ncbi:MAG: unidentified major facilitator-10 protein [Dehalococcoidia bacterium]|nr:unidentified major facilitator-10 protein [Dehalococcoidia bacterium]
MTENASPSTAPKRVFGLHPNVFFLGLVSFFTDTSSELIFTLLPLFLLNVLRVATPFIGLIEGIAESTATLLKFFSGWLSDRAGERKWITIVGYGISTAVKPFMLFATAWGAVLGVRFADRVGKGIRSAPRDAMIADSITPAERGKAYGLHRTMDTAGALLGILLAALVVLLTQGQKLELTAETFRKLVIFGLVPALLAMLMFFFVREKGRKAVTQTAGVPRDDPPPVAVAGNGFDARFKIFIGLMVVFTLGHFSDAFLILRAQERGGSVFITLLMLATFNLVYSFVSVPAGVLSDKLGRKTVLLMGWGLSILVYLGFAFAGENSLWQIWLLFAIYGVFYGTTEGVARAFVADLAGGARRGTAFGIYHGAVGVSLLPASLMAGFLWQAVSPAAPFLVGAGLSLVAAVGLLALVRR